MKKAIFPAVAAVLGLALSGGVWAAETEVPPKEEIQESRSAPAAGEAAEQGQFEEGEVRGVTRLLGRSVQGKKGDRLGEVSEIMIDIQRGQIAYLVVSSGGVLGVGEETRIIPWKAVYSDPLTAILTANIEADKFKGAPTDTEIADRQEEAEIHRFYGVAPYWQEERREMAPAAQPAEPRPQEAPGQREQGEELVPEPTPLWWE